MKFLISYTLIFILLIQLSSSQLCSCPDGKYFSPQQWKCKTNPNYQNPWYIKNCAKYLEQDGIVICSQCEQTYYLQRRQGGQPQMCIQTNIQNCKEIGKTSSLQQTNSVKNFLQLLSSGGSYVCAQCNQGSYWNGRICANNPTSRPYGFIYNCSQYKYQSGDVKCVQCESGYYLNGSSFMQRCIQNPQNKPQCQHFSISNNNQDPICTKCKQENYIIDNYGDCISPYQFVPRCVKGTYQFNSFKCQECENSYYVSKNGKQCIYFDQRQTDCIKMGYVNGKLECTQCNSFYYFNTKRKYCQIISTLSRNEVQNCLYYIGYATNDYYSEDILSCQKCKPGYQNNEITGNGITQCRQCPY